MCPVLSWILLNTFSGLCSRICNTLALPDTRCRGRNSTRQVKVVLVMVMVMVVLVLVLCRSCSRRMSGPHRLHAYVYVY